jgi:hypothetical protein
MGAELFLDFINADHTVGHLHDMLPAPKPGSGGEWRREVAAPVLASEPRKIVYGLSTREGLFLRGLFFRLITPPLFTLTLTPPLPLTHPPLAPQLPL